MSTPVGLNPQRLQGLGKCAFADTYVEKIQIPWSVETIGASCFIECESLCEITFERWSKLQRIEECAFGYTCVKKIQIPSSVETSGVCCFYGRQSLCETTFECGSRLQRIEKYGSGHTGVKRIEIPSSVEEIGARCFDFCRSLESLCEITFEWSVKDIGDGAFVECPLKCVRVRRGEKPKYSLPEDCRLEEYDA
jgi:hypothetical protein